MYQTKTFSFRHFKNTFLTASFLLITLGSMFSSTLANNDGISRVRFPFFIKNPGDKTITVEIHPSGCYYGTNPSAQEGIKTIKIGPGQHHEMTLDKSRASACDGKYGYFHLKFSNSPIQEHMVTFQVNSTGDMSENRKAYNYPGSLLPKKGNAYIYEAYVPLKGNWEVMCTGPGCATSKTKTEVRSNSQTTNISKSVEVGLSASVTAGVEYGSFSGESTVSSDFRSTISSSMTSCISSSNSNKTYDPGMSTCKMEHYGITAIWQYVVEARYKGKTYSIRTKHMTYTTTRTGGKPTWLPATVEDGLRSNLSELAKLNGTSGKDIDPNCK